MISDQHPVGFKFWYEIGDPAVEELKDAINKELASVVCPVHHKVLNRDFGRLEKKPFYYWTTAGCCDYAIAELEAMMKRVEDSLGWKRVPGTGCPDPNPDA